MNLKPCPFCGKEAEIARYGDSRQSTQYHCEWCGCFLETGEEFNHGEAWNKRSLVLPEGVELGSTTVVAGHGDYRSVYTISVENASPEVQKQFHALYEEQKRAVAQKYMIGSVPPEDQCSISRRNRGLSYSKFHCPSCQLGPCKFNGRW